MKKWKFLLLFLLFMPSLALAIKYEPLKVVVIDTGLPRNPEQFPKCIEMENTDLTGTGIYDFDGHATNVANLIRENAGEANVCYSFIKYTNNDKKISDRELVENVALAFKLAYEYGADVINYSGSGVGDNSEEKKTIKKLLERGTAVIVAAGNDSINFAEHCNIYPACYKSRFKTKRDPFKLMAVVGCTDLAKANKNGPINFVNSCKDKKVSYRDCSWDYKNAKQVCEDVNVVRSGTSQATAIVTGKLLKYFDKRFKEL